MRALRYLYRVPMLAWHVLVHLPVVLALVALGDAGRRPIGHAAIRWWSRNLLRVFGMRVHGVGTPLAGGTVYAREGHLEIARHGVREWLINGDSGLEHGFTLDDRPAGQGSLRLIIDLGGDLSATVSAGGAAVDFKDSDGRAVLRYSGLKVTDATGQNVAAHMEVHGRQLALVVNDERGVDVEAVRNVEGLLALTTSYFTYDRPKTNVDLTVQYYPSLSNGGRHRLQLDAGVKREIFSDFFVGVTVYNTYDNRPPNPTADRNDVGVVASISSARFVQKRSFSFIGSSALGR